ncbi:MAG: hypothetical protein ACRDYX_16820 [Egibacteraceae bacterium]
MRSTNQKVHVLGPPTPLRLAAVDPCGGFQGALQRMAEQTSSPVPASSWASRPLTNALPAGGR